MKSFSARNLALCSLLCAMALALSYMERLLPLQMLVPVPGIKLGLANIVTMFAIYFLGPLPAGGILAARCILSSAFGGGLTGLAFSLTGGMLALAAMLLAKRARFFSVYGVSVCGSAAHVTGQIAAAALLLGSATVIAYLPLLLLSSVVMGFITGAISSSVFRGLMAWGGTDRLK